MRKKGDSKFPPFQHCDIVFSFLFSMVSHHLPFSFSKEKCVLEEKITGSCISFLFPIFSKKASSILMIFISFKTTREIYSEGVTTHLLFDPHLINDLKATFEHCEEKNSKCFLDDYFVKSLLHLQLEKNWFHGILRKNGLRLLELGNFHTVNSSLENIVTYNL